MPPASDLPPPLRPRLAELARLFLKLGFTAFGGPAAHVALMEEEVVNRRQWLDRQHFLDMISAVNLIPGPNSTELAIHVGWVRAGWPGLIVAGCCFIVPAMLIILPLAWCYVTYGARPAVGSALVGIKACMVAIVAVALCRFARTGIKDAFGVAVALLALVVAAFCTHYGIPQQELIILTAAAIAGTLRYGRKRVGGGGGGVPMSTAPPANLAKSSKSLPLFAALPLAAGAAGFSAQIAQMALFFLKVGATLFGSGYVLASFLHNGLVERHRWLTERELLDAIAVGQVTPGPLLTASTFIGYVLGADKFGGGVGGGLLAGVIATGAIFLPSFLLVGLLGPFLPRLRQSPKVRGALDGMNAAVVSLIAIVTLWFAGSVFLRPTGGGIDWLSVGIAVTSLAVLLWTKVNATWLILAAGAIGILAARIVA